MIKRLRWMILGAGITWFARRRLQQSVPRMVERHAPPSVVTTTRIVSKATKRVREAVDIARVEKAQTEQRLRRDVYGAEIIDLPDAIDVSGAPNARRIR